ncbi:hypothetical protein [Tengunoibacter tsumagoiensis]|uniref:Uncharacterized protein n=1 Tax=Tengunoibacter tsumagoiensis TaxID=2014871 RepID=A0A401ZZU9_9CHLR|nr:hypothetical protein [Tengunoibacter tsumagoiensis]GCE12398.1 hypothetical protein KTT_22570 [Tengunoibacter tsumagoiensis]
MTLEQLLQECAQMTYADRMRHMVEVGRLAVSDESVRQTIVALAEGDVYQRTLAVQSCHGSRNSEGAALALLDRSRSVRALAVNIVPLLCSDGQVLDLLEQIGLDLKVTVISRLKTLRRQAPVDSYVEALAARQDIHLRRFLPLASPEVVQRHLSQMLERFHSTHWHRLVRYHPQLAFAYLQQQSAMKTDRDLPFVQVLNTVLPTLVSVDPDLALELVRTTLKHTPLAHLAFTPLILKRPQEMAELVLASNEQVRTNSFNKVAHKLNTDALLALEERGLISIHSYKFKRFNPEQRLALYNAFRRGWRNEEGILHLTWVAALPGELRRLEARRHLDLPILATRPLVRLRYAGLLPWEEARMVVESALRSKEAEMRSVALQALIEATRYQKAALPAALQLVLQRRNEQDPVRREMMLALAALPSSCWHEEHLPSLAQIIRDALDAADLSDETAQAIGKLVIFLLPLYPVWCAEQLALIYRERNLVHTFYLDRVLSDREIPYIASALQPLLHAWQARENAYQLLALGSIFGCRLRVFNELAEVLTTLLEQTRSQYVASSAARLLQQYQYNRLLALVPGLLERDESYIVIPAIAECLHRKRQDLLTPYLGQRTFTGKFTSGQVHIVLNFYDGFYRWTPEQQEIFARTLLALTHDNAQPTTVLQNVIQRLIAMPTIHPQSVIQFANDTRQPVRDTTLRALSWMDEGQGVPTLLEAMNDDRARVAIYALRRILLAMPPHEALSILRTMPLRQVTVAKEVVRLIGDLATEESYQELLHLTQRDLHRDVRVALLRSLWPYLERDETWDVLTKAASLPESGPALGVVNIPIDGLSLKAQQRLTNLFTILLTHPDPEVRIATLNRCAFYPFRDPDHTLYACLLQLMQSHLPDERSTAAQAAFAIYTGNDASLVGDTVRHLLANRQTLQSMLNAFVHNLSTNRKYLLPTTRSIHAVLAEDPLTLSWRLQILFWGLPWSEVIQEIIQMGPQLHADALSTVLNLIWPISRRPDADLAELENALATQADERLRRIALSALIAQTQQARGWSDEHIQRLQHYQLDSSPLVAAAAQFTFPV